MTSIRGGIQNFPDWCHHLYSSCGSAKHWWMVGLPCLVSHCAKLHIAGHRQFSHAFGVMYITCGDFHDGSGKGTVSVRRTPTVPFSDPSWKSPQVTYTTPNKRVWKLPTFTQLNGTWHSDSLDTVVLPSTGALRYHNCCIDGGTSPEKFG